MLFDECRDEELVVEVAWVLVYVTSMSDVHSNQLIHAGLLPPIVARLALSRHLPLLTPVRDHNFCFRTCVGFNCIFALCSIM